MLTVRWLPPSCQAPRPPLGYIQPRHLPPTHPRGWPAASARASRAHQPTCYFPINLLLYINQLLLFLFNLYFYLILIQPTCYFQKGGMGSLITFATTAFLPSLTYGLLGWTGWIRDGENGQIGSFFIWDSCFMLHADNSTVSKSISNVIIFLFKYSHRLTFPSWLIFLCILRASWIYHIWGLMCQPY